MVMRGGRFGRRGRTLIIGVVVALASRGVQAGSGISDNLLVFQKHTISSNDSQIAVRWNAIGGAETPVCQTLKRRVFA